MSVALPSAYRALLVPPSRRAHRFSSRAVVLLVLGDLASFAAAFVGAYLVVGAVYGPSALHLYHIALSGIASTIVWLVCFERFGLYRRSFALSGRDEFYATACGIVIGVVPQLIVFTIFPELSPSRVVLIVSAVLALIFDGGMRSTAHAFRDLAAMVKPQKLTFVGRADRLFLAENAMGPSGERPDRVIIDDFDKLLQESGPVPSARTIAAQPWFVEAVEGGAETIVMTELVPAPLLPALLEAASSANVKIAFALPRLQCHAFSLGIEIVGNQALIIPEALRATTPSAMRFKRIFDLLFASCACAIFAAPMLLIAGALALDRSGPIFYRQERIGRGGRVFEILKFRTMAIDAERAGAQLAVARDPRVTPLGRILRRTSLDELPQLLNVLRGEMSLVGPRPERPIFVERYRAAHPRYDERHLVAPGITGWAQTSIARVLTEDDTERKLACDLFYIENWSPILDTSVLLKTVTEVFFHRAA